LRQQAPAGSGQANASAPKKPRRTVRPTPTSDAPKSAGYELYGERHGARNATDVLVKVFREFADRDSSFLERFAALPKHGRKRRYLARTREELYPGSPQLVGNAHEVRPGWYVDSHASKAGIETRLKMACEVAGAKYGKDLLVNLG
jgi:hypothetical protein